MAKTQIFKDYDEFLAREDKSLNGVTAEFAKENHIDIDKDDGNVGCWNCVGCVRCVGCVDSKDCEDCVGVVGDNMQEPTQTVENDPTSPNHYKTGGIECIDAIRAMLGKEGFEAYCRGNVVKYNWRYKEKNGLEDLKKAAVYQGWLNESVGARIETDKT